MKVDSQARVANLNADKVDGLDAEQLRGARAYARVDSGIGSDNLPHLEVSRTSGFTAVSSPTTGLYCLTPANGIDQQAEPAVVSVDWSTTNRRVTPRRCIRSVAGLTVRRTSSKSLPSGRVFRGAPWCRCRLATSASPSSCPRQPKASEQVHPTRAARRWAGTG